jgi:hypothetical protein
MGAAPGVELGTSATLPHPALPHAGIGYVRVPGGLARREERLGLAALGGLFVCALLLSVGAANTDGLLPESVRPVPGWLAGPFGGTGLNLGWAPLIALFVLMFGCYVVATTHAERLSPRVVLAAIAALHAVLLLAPPLLSTDVFSYQAYAKIWSLYGGNPYLQGPHAIALDSVYPFIGAKWVNTPSTYGPLFTALSYPFAHLSIAASALAYKAIATVASLGTVALLWHAARLRGLNPTRAVALFAFNPLLLVYGVGGGHNDLLMLMLMVAGVWAFLAHRDRLAGVSAVLAGAVKLTGGLMLPFMLAGQHGLGGGPRRRRTAIAAGLAAAASAAFGLTVFGWGQLHLFATLGQTQSEGDWHSIPGFISTRLGLGTIGQITGVVLGVVFVGLLGWLVVRVARDRLDPIDGAGWATVALLLTAGSLLPWYVAWLLPLAALATDRRLWRTSLLISGVVLGIQLVGYVPHGSSLLGL